MNFAILGGLKTEHDQLGGQDFSQQQPQPPEQHVEVVANRGEHGVDGVADAVSFLVRLFREGDSTSLSDFMPVSLARPVTYISL